MRIASMCTLAVVVGITTQAPAQDAPAPSAKPAPAGGAQPAQAAATQSTPSAALGLYVFPAKDQSAEQQKQDETACYAWAQEQSGIDPANVKANPDSAAKAAKAKTDSATTGAAVAGGARGAAGGAVVGAIAGDAGTGAAIGAVAGAARGRKAKKQAEKQAGEQAAQQANAGAAQQIDTFKKAMTACLEGKGYTVK